MLIDLRAEAERLGLKYPSDQPHYTIECCGNALSIEDNKLYYEVVNTIKQQRGSDRLP
jgi:hypothetical protein